METLELPAAVQPAEVTEAPPKMEEQELDTIAFELWQEANRPASADDNPHEEEVLRGHASCL